VSVALPDAVGAAPSDLVELGRVTGAYGIRGWVKVEAHTARSDTLLGAKTWWLAKLPPAGDSAPATAPQAWRVLKSRTQGSHVVAHLQGLDIRESAEALRGYRVWVSRAAFPAADDDEYYWVDLIGCTVHGLDGESPVVLGTVIEVIDNGAHAVLHIGRIDPAGEPLRDAKGRQVMLMVPFVAAHVQSVDLAARRIDTDWPLDF